MDCSMGFDLLFNWADSYSKLGCFLWLSHLTLWIAHFLIKLPPSQSHHNAIGDRSTLYDITMVQGSRSIWSYFPYHPASMYGYHCALETQSCHFLALCEVAVQRRPRWCVREWTNAVNSLNPYSNTTHLRASAMPGLWVAELKDKCGDGVKEVKEWWQCVYPRTN